MRGVAQWSCGGLEEDFLQRLGQIDRKEPIRGIPVVLATLVDDPEVPMPCRRLIQDHAIELPDLKRGLVALVVDAYRETNLRSALSFHFSVQKRELDLELSPADAMSFVPM